MFACSSRKSPHSGSMKAVFGYIALASALANPVHLAKRDKAVPDLNSDEFANYTGDVADFPKGHVLKWRQETSVHYNHTSIVQLVFRTETALGDPDVGLTTVFIPEHGNGKTIISYQMAADSCDPAMAAFGTKTDFSDQITDLLNRGHVVNLPNYAGLNQTYGANVYGGKIVLDSIKAVLATRENITNITNSQVGLLGLSEGGSATGFAAEMLESYAPDLEIAGVAMRNPITNPIHWLEQAWSIDNLNSIASAFPSAVIGLASAYPKLWDELYPVLDPDELEEFMDWKGSCAFDSWGYGFFDYDVGAMPNDMFFVKNTDVLNLPHLRETLKNNTLGTGTTPKMPVFFYENAESDFSNYGRAGHAVDHYCNTGGKVIYRNYTKDDISFDDTDFLEGIFNGTVHLTKCELIDDNNGKHVTKDVTFSTVSNTQTSTGSPATSTGSPSGSPSSSQSGSESSSESRSQSGSESGPESSSQSNAAKSSPTKAVSTKSGSTSASTSSKNAAAAVVPSVAIALVGLLFA